MSDQEIIETLEQSGDYRVLRRVDLTGLATEAETEYDFSLRSAVVLDLETTGLDPERHAVIEVALRTVHFDEKGVIVALGAPLGFLEDPGEPIPPAIQRLTGLTDADVAGQRIDAGEVARMVMRAGMVISHNAGFDRKFFEARFPLMKDLAWACSCKEVAWPGHGFDGRGLQALLAQAGWFAAEAHRAGADVDATIALLMHRFNDTGETVLAGLLEVSDRATWRVEAVGAAFEVKNDLKERGYRWNPRECFWWKEVEESGLDPEKRWLHANVYAPRHAASAEGPRIQKITNRERHR